MRLIQLVDSKATVVFGEWKDLEKISHWERCL